MTGEELFDSLRFLLHDRERNSDTGALFYSDELLGRVLTDALAQILREMIFEKPRRSHVSVGRLTASVAIVSGQSVPSDFWILECGTLAGAYVPAIQTDLGELIQDLSIAKLYVSSGAFFGPADTAVYFKTPPTITPTSAALPYFSDAVYHSAKTLAATNALIQESKSAPHRWVFFGNDYKVSRATLV